MPKSLTAKCLLLAAVVCSVFVTNSKAYADDTGSVTFNITPKRCVTLRQGQPCFARVRFTWKSIDEKRMCLVKPDGSQIKCWESANQGTFLVSQSLRETTEYKLVDSEGLEMQGASVVVSWVYRNKRAKRRWRLF